MKKLVIGRNEMVEFPDLGIEMMKGRVDTGARTSSIHAINLEVYEVNDERWVRFDFEGYAKLEVKLWKQKYVRSSNGKRESRYFIKTRVRLGNGKRYPITLSLTDRSKMKFPVLLGRRLLAGRFLVDVKRVFVLGGGDAKCSKVD